MNIDQAINKYFEQLNIPLPIWSVGQYMTIAEWEAWFKEAL